MSSKEVYRLTIIKTPSELSLNYPILFLCLEYTVLNAKQALCLDKFLRRCQHSLRAGPNNRVPSFLLNLDDTADIGKTPTINAIYQTAIGLMDEADMGGMVIVRRLASTGIAALHIHRSTYHSSLGSFPNGK